jgi:hypothetical protein
LVASGANEASTPARASSARTSSPYPNAARVPAYSPVIVAPVSAGMSVFTVTVSPASRSAGSGCSASDGAKPSATFDDGQTSSAMPRSRTSATRSASARIRMP